MGLDRASADAEVEGHYLVGSAPDKAFEDLALARPASDVVGRDNLRANLEVFTTGRRTMLSVADVHAGVVRRIAAAAAAVSAPADIMETVMTTAEHW